MDTNDQLRTPSTLAELASSEPSLILSRYEILEESDRGAMGVVYRGRYRLLDHQVAIKLCMPGKDIERFQREGKLLASIRSPHVVPVHDFEFLPDGRAFLVMDWVAGQDLRKLLDDNNGPFPESRALPWMLQVCEGMRAAVDQGIVHRDLKPSNILVDQLDRAHVADFGLARSASVDQLTLTGGIMGTPHYMSPEQAEDPIGVDTRADIYSFGATFYHVLVGQTPFRGDTAFSILYKHRTEPLIAPRARNPMLSKHVSECLERCLAKAPQQRFTTFREVQASLQVPTLASPWNLSDDPALAHYLERYHSRRGIYLQGRSDDLPEPDVFVFPNQHLLTIGFGNLVEQEVDVLVSSDDETLSMGGGVSAALQEAAGLTLAEEALRYGPVRAGRAVVTSAGALPARFVFHAVVAGAQRQEWVLPSRDVILEAMESCFYHADTLSVESIAFPLLGTGAGEFSSDVCLDTMFQFLTQKFVRGLTTVRLARIVLFSKSVRKE